MIKVTTSDGVMTEFTDAKGFVDLGSFSDGEVGTVEIQGYNNLVKEFIFSSFVDYMALEMTPMVSKNSIGIFLYIFLKIFINKYALYYLSLRWNHELDTNFHPVDMVIVNPIVNALTKTV